MFENLETKLGQIWDRIKAFFSRSETVFLAFLTTVAGAATTLFGLIDFSPLWSTLGTGTFLSKEQTITIGIGIFGKGIVDYIARVRHTKEIEGHLVPTVEALPEDIKPITKKVRKPRTKKV